MQFARSIILGNGIANSLEKSAEKIVLPYIKNILPDAYIKWARPLMVCTIKGIAGIYEMVLLFLIFLV